MCLIVVQYAGDIPIESDVFRNAWSSNDDGAGYMFCANDKLIMRKPYFALAELQASYNADFAAHGHQSPFVAHFRYATHGNKDQIHPFGIACGRIGMVHNGILDGFTPPHGSSLSDTAWFAATVLRHRDPGEILSAGFLAWIAELIGKRNKLAFLSESGQVEIVNADMGIVDGKRWYSNTSYLSL